MCIKTPVCQASFLAITVILHSVTAQVDSISVQALLDFKLERFEEKLMDRLLAQNKEVLERQTAFFENLESFTNNLIAGQLDHQNRMAQMTKDLQHHNSLVKQEVSRQCKEVIEILDRAHARNAQQMADSVKNLQSITDELLVGQIEMRVQLTNMTNDLHRHKSDGDQEKAKLNEIHTLLHSTFDQNKQVIDTITVQATNARQMADSIKYLRHVTEDLPAGQLEIRKEVASARKELQHIIAGVFPSSCATLNSNVTGTYYIRPAGAVEPFLVRCDFEDNFNLGGGWTVFQHRYDGSVDFYRNWTAYRDGFGDVTAEHWLGLEKLHILMKSVPHEMLTILEDFDDNHSYAHYDYFKIGNDDEDYKLTVGNYSGTAGDSLVYHNGMKFSTFDRPNPTIPGFNCGEKYRGAWWFNACYHSHLNGEYHRKGERIRHEAEGVVWGKWKGWNYSLKSAKMMLRRRSA